MTKRAETFEAFAARIKSRVDAQLIALGEKPEFGVPLLEQDLIAGMMADAARCKARASRRRTP
jgi:hypothetical protein